MLTAEGFSETGPLMHLSNHVFQKYLSYKAHVCFKMFKVQRRFQKCNKIVAKYFCFFG